MPPLMPIEYCGMVHERDHLTTTRESRERRLSSISLQSSWAWSVSDLETDSNRTVAAEWGHCKDSAADLSTQNPDVGVKVDVIGTDLYGLQAMNASINMKEMTTPTQPTPFERFINTPEPYELIALSLPVGPRPRTELRRQAAIVALRNVCLPAARQSPMTRYLASGLEAHELLALSLQQSSNGPPRGTPDYAAQYPVSSISLTDRSGEDEEGDEINEVLLAKYRERKRKRALEPIRQHRQVRKRLSTSPGQESKGVARR